LTVFWISRGEVAMQAVSFDGGVLSPIGTVPSYLTKNRANIED
jgi:hypothetical protein